MNIPLNASKLNLSNQGLVEIPTDIFDCNYLTKLDLSQNNIKTLPKNISKLRFLKVLDLSGNKISNIYANIFQIRSLEVLILNNNQIKKLPPQIEKLINLSKLMISNNELETLPEGIERLKNLRSLNISKNPFKHFPQQILKLSNLESLWLTGNAFEDFPSKEIVDKLKSLQRIYCFSLVQDSIYNNKNDYEILQQKHGNCIEALHLITRQSESIVTKINNMKDKKIFISYSHRDIKYKDEIEVALKGIPYLGYEIDFWSDTKLDAGDLLKETIVAELDSAQIVINIVSRHYLASKFIQEIELPKMLEKAETEGALILNVIAGSCEFMRSLLSKFVAVNDPKTPLAKLKEGEQDDIYLALTSRVIKKIEN